MSRPGVLSWDQHCRTFCQCLVATLLKKHVNVVLCFSFIFIFYWPGCLHMFSSSQSHLAGPVTRAFTAPRTYREIWSAAFGRKSCAIIDGFIVVNGCFACRGPRASQFTESVHRPQTCTWSLLLTLRKWLVITQYNGVMDSFLKGHGDSR